MDSIRTIHGITFRDELAWMEGMKGKRWETFLQKQKTRFRSLLDKETLEQIPLLQKELEASYTISQAPLLQAGENGQVEVASKGFMHFVWNWKGESKKFESTALCVKGNYIWTIEETGNGAELYTVRCYKKGQEKFCWEQKGVGPYVSVVGNHCYCLGAKKILVYYKLITFDSLTGTQKQELYEEKDYRYNLELIGCFMRRQAGEKQDIFKITESDVKLLEGISLESRRFVFDEKSYRRVGSENIEAYDSKRNLVITKDKGERTLRKGNSILWKGVGQVLLDPFGGPWVRFIQPGEDCVWWNSDSDDKPPKAVNVSLSFTPQRKVPYILVSKHKKPTNVLIVGYGAYGMTTPLATARWKPLLQRGWCIAIGMWRGGGDDTPEWEDAGRVKGRMDTLLDAEEVVKDVRKQTSINAKHTFIFGRSAGGLWVGGLVARHPRGDLFGAAYMEVPYLDVLRTTTNRNLPLTDIETDEFGLPEQRLSDMRSMMEWSPMETLKEKPKVFQLVRTGLNDSQVLAYESAKWVERCGENSFLAVESDQGHFVSGEKGETQNAMDLAILLSLNQ